MVDTMIGRCAVCARREPGDEERVELSPGLFVHRGHCLARWTQARPPQRAAWTARGRRWADSAKTSRKLRSA